MENFRSGLLATMITFVIYIFILSLTLTLLTKGFESIDSVNIGETLLMYPNVLLLAAILTLSTLAFSQLEYIKTKLDKINGKG